VLPPTLLRTQTRVCGSAEGREGEGSGGAEGMEGYLAVSSLAAGLEDDDRAQEASAPGPGPSNVQAAPTLHKAYAGAAQ